MENKLLSKLFRSVILSGDTKNFHMMLYVVFSPTVLTLFVPNVKLI